MRLLKKLRRLLLGYRPADYSLGLPVSSKVNCWLCGRRSSSVFLVSDKSVALCQRHDPRYRNPAEEWHLMWEIAPDEQTLLEMREYGCKFAAYQNTELLHPQRGFLKFLRYGYMNCNYVTSPEVFPVPDDDGVSRYKVIGYVNLETGTIHKDERHAKVEGDPYGSGEDERLLPPSQGPRLWTD